MVMKYNKEEILQKFNCDIHAVEQLQYRFNISPNYIKNNKFNFKAGHNPKYPAMNKPMFSDQLPVYCEQLNLFMMYCFRTKSFVTAMNLDSTDGKLSYYDKIKFGMRVHNVNETHFGTKKV